MSMAHCRGCGTQIHETAPICPRCGAPQAVVLKATVGAVPGSTSDSWREVLALIEKASGASGFNMSRISTRERFKVMFNLWAFFFGPFYYAAKGMWKRAIAYSLLMVAGIILFELAFGSRPPATERWAARRSGGHWPTSTNTSLWSRETAAGC